MGTRVMKDFSNPADGTGGYEYDRQGQQVNEGRENFLTTSSYNRSPSGQTPTVIHSEDESKGHTDQVVNAIGMGIGMGSVLAEHLLSHPCIVMRRQCQVHHTGAWYHITPLSLLPTIIGLQRSQGGMVLWKGLSSVYMVKGVNMMTENVLSEITSLPREVSRHSSIKKYGGHLLLKGLTFAMTTPFYAASLVETVQSDIASERPRVIDVLKEGWQRLWGWAQPQTSMLVPVWTLAAPTVVLRLSHYCVSSIAQFTVLSAIHLEQEQMRNQIGVDRKGPSVYETYFPDLLAGFTGGLLADILTYPLETVLHRLYVQGTRTIIDDLDVGIGVIPINIRYAGIYDCFKSILEDEGIPGFYRGFGALVAQYIGHFILLRLAKFLFEYLSQEIYQRHTELEERKKKKGNSSELE